MCLQAVVKLCKANQKERPIYLKAKVGPFERFKSWFYNFDVNILLFHFESLFLNFHYSSEIKWQVGDKLQSENYGQSACCQSRHKKVFGVLSYT